MPKQQNKGILDSETGLWLIGVTTNPDGFIWGDASKAIILTDDQIEILATKLGDAARYGGGAVIPDKGF